MSFIKEKIEKIKNNKTEIAIYAIAITIALVLFMISSYVWLYLLYDKYPEKVFFLEHGYMVSQAISLFGPAISAAVICSKRKK